MTITECGGFLRMGGCTKMQSDEAHIIIWAQGARAGDPLFLS